MKIRQGSLFRGGKVVSKKDHCPHCDREHFQTGLFLARYAPEGEHDRRVIETLCLRCNKISFPGLTKRMERAASMGDEWIWKKDKNGSLVWSKVSKKKKPRPRRLNFESA